MALTECGATRGLKRGLSAWRADRRVVSLKRLHDQRDRKENAKQYKRQSQQQAVPQRLERHIGGHRGRVIAPLQELDRIARRPSKPSIRDLP
jgi:hypothetical protein